MAVEIDLHSDHTFYSARTRDISVGGLFIETDVALPIGTRVWIDLKFLKKHIKAEAEVTWVLVGSGEGEPFGFGVHFVHLPEPAKKSIEAFMVLRQPMAFGTVENDDDEPAEPISETRPSQRLARVPVRV